MLRIASFRRRASNVAMWSFGLLALASIALYAISYLRTVTFGTPIQRFGTYTGLGLFPVDARRIEFGGDIVDGRLTFLLYLRSNWLPDPAMGWYFSDRSLEVPGTRRHVSLTSQIDWRYSQLEVRTESGDPWTVARLHCSVFSLPMWLVSIVLTIPTIVLIRKKWARFDQQRNPGPYCGKCGYSLFELASHRCPECGTSIRAAEPQAIEMA